MNIQNDTDRISQTRDLITQGTLQLRQGQLAEARATFEVVLQIAPGPEAVDGLGCVALLESDFEQAEYYFIKGHRLFPDYGNSLANLALLYEVTGRKSQAVALYERALVLNPKNIRIRSNFGALLSDLSKEGLVDMVSARHEFKRAQSLGNHPIIEADLKKLDEAL